jgi:hypothetical protein
MADAIRLASGGRHKEAADILWSITRLGLDLAGHGEMEAEGHGLALLMGHPLSELADSERLQPEVAQLREPVIEILHAVLDGVDEDTHGVDRTILRLLLDEGDASAVLLGSPSLHSLTASGADSSLKRPQASYSRGGGSRRGRGLLSPRPPGRCWM